MNIIRSPLKKGQYYEGIYTKKQIVIHHTASGTNFKNVVSGWNSDPVRVGTAYGIDGSGEIHQAFDEAMWAHHLGLKTANNEDLNKGSIGIEVCNWGPIKEKDGKYYNYLDREVPSSEVVQMPKFKGYELYHVYTSKQVESLRILLIDICTRHKIPMDYNQDMWDVSKNALAGKPGIWTHVSFRADKFDMSPQTELIQMLKSLK